MKGLAIGFLLGCLAGAATPAHASCTSPANAIEAENCLPGNPTSEWDLSTKTGDPSIVGYTTDISYNPGDTVSFKIDTNATSYIINIYRMGYYGNMGARKVASVTPTSFPTQPACFTDPATYLVDCGNWAVTATWAIPANAVSGVYVAKIIRSDTGGASQIYFIVRNDAGSEDILFNTADTTWQAYSAWEGHSLYMGPPSTDGGYKVSYNRPFVMRSDQPQSSFFQQEYPMLRWLEANGYSVAYFTDVDDDRRGSSIKNHRILMTSGHEEYWSLAQRNNIEAARNAGVHMAFFGEEVGMAKTRWENSIDGTNTPYRTLVCYKESFRGRIDPMDPPIWTGAWRDTRYSPPDDGGRPEIALVGSQFAVDAGRNDTMYVDALAGRDRLWRNTSAAALGPGQSASYPQTLGTQWDESPDTGYQPPGLIQMSSSSYYVPDRLNGFDFGPGPATHHLTFYKHPSGALVFSAGTEQWQWALDAHHDGDTDPPVQTDLQQATVNILADMSAQPATLQPGLLRASPSTDITPPVSLVRTAPQTYTAGTLVTISGTAADYGGGVVGGVEVSIDGGASWHPAVGHESWTYSWTQAATDFVSAMSRATDDSGNIEGSASGNPVPSVVSLAPSNATPGGPGFTLVVVGSNFISSSTVLWNGQSRSTTFLSNTQLGAIIPASDIASAGTAAVTVFNPAPGGGTSNASAFSVTAAISGSTVTIFTTQLPAPNGYNINPKSLEVGVRFRSDVAGQIIGVRFYKVSGNSGQHSGHLWTNTGTLLGSVTFTGESASGWQSMSFPSPIPIQANTTYVASYFSTTGYADTTKYFTTAGVDNPPLHGLQSGVDGLNGIYGYSSAPVFPSQSTNDTNYWVDVVFAVPGSTSPTTNPVPTLSSLSPSSATTGSPTFTLAVNGSNFISSSTVVWNGQARATVLVSSTLLNASILAGDLAAPTTAAVAVFNPAPGGGTSTAVNFPVYAPPPPPNPVPSLTALSPSSATTGSPGFILGINGSNFIGSSTVLWNGQARATAIMSSTLLSASILAGDLAAPTTAAVTVFNPAPGGRTSKALPFVVNPSTPGNPVPLLTALAPPSATAGGAGFPLNVAGADFISSSTVLWNGQARATVFVSSTLLNVAILASDLVAPATAAVTVFNPAPGGGNSPALLFTVSATTTATGILFSDNFNRPNGLISNEYAFLNPSSTSAIISSTWVVSGGSLFISSGMAWTGLPDNVAPNAGSTNGTGSATLRVLGRDNNLGDITVSFGLTNLGFVTTATTPAESYDGVNLELRYQNEQSYYYAAVNRRDSTVVIKKVSAGTTTGLASAAFAAPLGIPQNVQVSVHNSSGTSVTLTLAINGSQLLSITDSAAPLTASGAVGFRGNNIDFQLADFIVQAYGSAPLAPAELRAPTAPLQFSDLDAARVYPNPWRSDRYTGLAVTIDRVPPQSEIRFYTIAGRWVKTVTAPAGIGTWDLTNDSGQRVASGLYLYLINEPGGQHRSGTFAVIH